MFGFVHESIRQLVVRKYGAETWTRVLQRCDFESGKENIIMNYYKDSDTYKMVDAVSHVIGMTVDEVWETYGAFLIQFTMETGWDEILRTLSADLKGFLDNLDALHYFIDHVVYKANLKGPSFRCESNEDGTLTLHYFTRRSGLNSIVKGVIGEVARRVFNMEIDMFMTGLTQQVVQLAHETHLEEHVTFKIQILKGPKTTALQWNSDKLTTQSCFNGALMLGVKDFSHIFPYHVVFDGQLIIEHCGDALMKMFPSSLHFGETKLTDIADMVRPDIQLDFPSIVNFINGIFVFKTKSAIKDMNKEETDESISVKESSQLLLKGQMILIGNGVKMLYLCSPYLTSIRELLTAHLRLSNLPLHDATRDLILLNQQRLSQVELSKRLEQTTSELREIAQKLEDEKAKTEALLCEVLPPSVAQQMVKGKTVDASEYLSATILFSDIPMFQNIVQECKPIEIVSMLNELFIRMDRLVTLCNVYKVETVGDNYMVVGGVPEPSNVHAETICYLALGMLWEARVVVEPISKLPLQIRIGVHTGPIVAGVVGRKMPRYCLFGDTVNTASRMESHGRANKIHCSLDTKDAAEKTGRFQFEDRGYIDVKGKGSMNTFFLLFSKKRSLWEIIQRERTEDQSIDGYTELNEPTSFNAFTTRDAYDDTLAPNAQASSFDTASTTAKSNATLVNSSRQATTESSGSSQRAKTCHVM